MMKYSIRLKKYIASKLLDLLMVSSFLQSNISHGTYLGSIFQWAITTEYKLANRDKLMSWLHDYKCKLAARKDVES